MRGSTNGTEFEEMEDSASGELDTVTDTKAEAIQSAVSATSQAHIERGGSLTMDIQLTTTNYQWLRDFKSASPSSRAVMLSQILDLFNDGQEGIFLSFSEPKIT